MNMTAVNITVPENMTEWIDESDSVKVFERNAMMLYPYIKDLTISYGKAAEILGVHKYDLIELYGKMGIPYFDADTSEIEEELEVYRSYMVKNK